MYLKPPAPLLRDGFGADGFSRLLVLDDPPDSAAFHLVGTFFAILGAGFFLRRGRKEDGILVLQDGMGW